MNVEKWKKINTTIFVLFIIFLLSSLTLWIVINVESIVSKIALNNNDIELIFIFEILSIIFTLLCFAFLMVNWIIRVMLRRQIFNQNHNPSLTKMNIRKYGFLLIEYNFKKSKPIIEIL